MKFQRPHVIIVECKEINISDICIYRNRCMWITRIQCQQNLNSQAITETIAKINDQKIKQDLPMN